jgi:integral membrane protein (TIGR01906 family)
MDKNKLLLMAFCLFSLIMIIMLSYKVNLNYYGLTVDQEETVNYLQGKNELNINYTESEQSHLQDVQKVMNFIDYLFYFSLLVITLIITYYKKDKQQLKKLFFYAGITVILVVGIILLLSLLNFNSSFTLFHKIFFPQGNWIFPLNSLLIQTFPLQFFTSISRNIFITTLILGIIFILLSKWLIKR